MKYGRLMVLAYKATIDLGPLEYSRRDLGWHCTLTADLDKLKLFVSKHKLKIHLDAYHEDIADNRLYSCVVLINV